MGFQLEPPMAWIIILVVMVLIEVFTMGLTTIWFAGGALAAFVVSIAGGGNPRSGACVSDCFSHITVADPAAGQNTV